MRVVFLAVVLAGAIYYSYVAFADLNFLSRTGRPGPGFFPRLIGVSAVIVTFWTLIETIKNSERAHTDSQRWKDVLLLLALTLGYVVLLRLFGGFFATVIFLGTTLMILNRTQLVKNLLLAVLVPGGVYLLFDKVLNANMPPPLITISF